MTRNMVQPIKIRSDFVVELVDFMGGDTGIVKAAKVSTLRDLLPDETDLFRFINFLMKNRHGSPFEHGAMTFRITGPIFMWREFMRHRIGFSYNEQSARYMEMLPEFYIPAPDRPLVQIGTPGKYEFVAGDELHYQAMQMGLSEAYENSWAMYQYMLNHEIAKEVARMSLPVGIYSTAYVTCNPRSLMSFLSLRTKVADSAFPSYPQWEINQVANLMEESFSEIWPVTHDAFNQAGRVSP